MTENNAASGLLNNNNNENTHSAPQEQQSKQQDHGRPKQSKMGGRKRQQIEVEEQEYIELEKKRNDYIIAIQAAIDLDIGVEQYIPYELEMIGHLDIIELEGIYRLVCNSTGLNTLRDGMVNGHQAACTFLEKRLEGTKTGNLITGFSNRVIAHQPRYRRIMSHIIIENPILCTLTNAFFLLALQTTIDAVHVNKEKEEDKDKEPHITIRNHRKKRHHNNITQQNGEHA